MCSKCLYFLQRQVVKRGALIIYDMAKLRGEHTLRCFFRVSPKYYLRDKDGIINVVKKGSDEVVGSMEIGSDTEAVIHYGDEITHYAVDFGKLEETVVLELKTCFTDEVAVQTKIDINSL